MKFKKILLTSLSIFTVMTSTVIPTFANDSKAINNYETSVYARDYFSGRTGKLNSFNGRESGASRISSGSVNGNAKVTGIELNIDVSRGSDPFYVIIQNPDGKRIEKYISTSGGRIKLNDFNGILAKGKWYVSIRTTGIVSTATVGMKVNYEY